MQRELHPVRTTSCCETRRVSRQHRMSPRSFMPSKGRWRSRAWAGARANLLAVDLDQLAHVFTAMARLVKALAFGPRPPDPGLDHPAAQRLARDPHIVAVRELLGSQGWAEIRIMLAHQGDGLVAQNIRQAI